MKPIDCASVESARKRVQVVPRRRLLWRTMSVAMYSNAEFNRHLEVYLLGRVDYDRALLWQRRLAFDVGESQGKLAALALCEHPRRIMTVGWSASLTDLMSCDATRAAGGIPVRWVRRCGGCILHGPGQISAYPVISLDAFGLTRTAYRNRLFDWLAATLADFGVPVESRPESGSLESLGRRIASLGIALTHGVAYQGVSLHVGGSARRFRLLEVNRRSRFTTIEAVRQRPVAMHRVRETLVRRFVEIFGVAQHHVFTSHPILQSKAKQNVPAGSLG